MCGIAGVYQLEAQGAELPLVLDRMSGAMIHRGPDEEGCWIVPELRAGLAVRRLSIIDLVTGGQPLVNEDGSIALACNGEIYNYRTLRRELEARGHRFRSGSDCEVVLHLYEEHGPECLNRLDGMFGLAILDRREQRLLLARDPAGMKPLYYANTPKGFLFASEAKPLLISKMISAEPDWEGLNTFLAAEFVPAPRTCFRGIRRMRAGEFLSLTPGKERSGKFWTMRFDNSGPRRSDEEYAGELDRRLEQAVASHLAADVPVGAFISGGWDSSLTAWFASRLLSRPLKTFSIVFPEQPEENEAKYSRLLAKHIGSEHQEVEFRTDQVPDLMRKVVEAVEEPCTAAPSPLLYQLSAAAGKELKVVVSGEGSDELFGGYPWLRGEWLYRVRPFVPRPLVRPLADRVLDPRWGRFWRVLAAGSDRIADMEWLRGYTQHQKRSLLNPDLPFAEGPDFEPFTLPPETLESCVDRQQERLSQEFMRRLGDGLLLINDKVSMAHSLEIRMPFLDRNVIEFALSLPSSMKMRSGREKYILSKLTGRLPPEIARRRKYGLHFPMLATPSGRFPSFVRDTLLNSSRQPGLFHRARLEPWLDDVLAGRRKGMRLLWILTFLAIWWDGFMAG